MLLLVDKPLTTGASVSICKFTVVCVAVVVMWGCNEPQSNKMSDASRATREHLTEFSSARANTSSAEGQYWMANKYTVAGNFPEAKKWMRKSAEQGYLMAQVSIKSFYSADAAAGRACGPDPIEEFAWRAVLIHRYAAIPDGQKMVSSSSAVQEKRKQNLTPDQLAEAQSRATEYIEKYGSGK